MSEAKTTRRALVTGAGRGIGRAIADELAAAGWHVICVSLRAESCEAAAEAIRTKGGKADALAVDVADGKAVKKAFKALLELHGPIDTLVNNAGITKDMLLLRMSPETWEGVIQTNLSGCFYCTQALAPSMVRARYGRIINISSIIGLAGNAGQANYAAAKAGIIGFTKSIALELASRNITANAIAPGFIETDMTAELPEKMREAAIARIPMKRLGKAEDISKMALWLASEPASYITGQTFTVDGGLCMR